jgi:uncharacterized membrane protein
MRPSAKKPDCRKTGEIDRLCHPELAEVVQRNIRSIEEHKRAAEESRNYQERIADIITRVSGSLAFVCAHVVWFAVWVLANIGLLGIPAFDPFPFGLLTTIVSLEAIFLSTFVLVSQNRQAAVSDRRAQLDLQINLLAEYEITRLLKLQDAIAKRLGVEKCDPDEIKDLKKDIAPEAVLEELEAEANHESKKRPLKNRTEPQSALKGSTHGKQKGNGQARAARPQRR